MKVYIFDSKRKITKLGLSKSSAKMMISLTTIGRVGINQVELSTNQGFKSIIIDETEYKPKYE